MDSELTAIQREFPRDVMSRTNNVTNNEGDTSRGKFFWNSIIDNIIWKTAWLIPFKYCINNKTKEIHFKILHTIYPVKSIISRYSDIDDLCTFCKNEKEVLTHLVF